MAHASLKDLLPPSEERSRACPDSLQNVERPARVCILPAAGILAFASVKKVNLWRLRVVNGWPLHPPV